MALRQRCHARRLEGGDGPRRAAHHRRSPAFLGRRPRQAPQGSGRSRPCRSATETRGRSAATYLPADYRARQRRHRVVGTVYVETEWDPADPLGETRWVEDLGARRASRAPWCPGAARPRRRRGGARPPGRCPLVRGIRHKPRGRAVSRRRRQGAAGSMGDPRWRAGYARLARHGLSFDLQTPWWHLARRPRWPVRSPTPSSS